MKKIIAKTKAGMEYIYFTRYTYQAAQNKIEKICKAMNDIRYNLKPCELWHIYTVDEFEYKNAAYKLVNRQGKLYVSEIWSVFH